MKMIGKNFEMLVSGDRDIWDIANVAGFFNMTNRVASAVAMRPNEEYHEQSR